MGNIPFANQCSNTQAYWSEQMSLCQVKGGGGGGGGDINIKIVACFWGSLVV